MIRMLMTIGLLLSSLTASADQWVMNAAESSLRFAVSYTGETVPGRFTRFDTLLDFDPQDPAAGQLTVTVDTAGADMDSADINEAIAGSDWFDVGAFPTAIFTSDTLEAQTDGSFVARGTLELKGMRRDVAVPFSWNESASGAVMTGSLSLDRTQFSIGTGEWASGELIGLEVRVEFNVLLQAVQ